MENTTQTPPSIEVQSLTNEQKTLVRLYLLLVEFQAEQVSVYAEAIHRLIAFYAINHLDKHDPVFAGTIGYATDVATHLLHLDDLAEEWYSDSPDLNKWFDLKYEPSVPQPGQLSPAPDGNQLNDDDSLTHS